MHAMGKSLKYMFQEILHQNVCKNSLPIGYEFLNGLEETEKEKLEALIKKVEAFIENHPNVQCVKYVLAYIAAIQ